MAALQLSAWNAISQELQSILTGDIAEINGSLKFNGGTANGVPYLNGSKVLTSGSALTFDGTNLGIGGTPTCKLDVVGSGAYARVSNVSGDDGVEFGWNEGGNSAYVQAYDRNASAFRDLLLNNSLRVSSVGNAGLGVTPSAWRSDFKVLQIGQGASFASYIPGSFDPSVYVTTNAVFTTDWHYIGAEAATQYQQYKGAHQWYTAPSGTAGAAITFTQAMTLDASSALTVGRAATATATPFTLSLTNTYLNASLATTPAGVKFKIYDNGANVHGITPTTSGLQYYVGSVADHIFTIDNNGTEAVRIKQTTGNVGIGIASPDGKLHVHTASAGVVTPAASADDLVVENSTSGGISILSPDNAQAQIFFGSPSDSVGAYTQWVYNNNLFRIGTSKVGASLQLSGGDEVTNLTLSGAVGSELALFSKDVTIRGDLVIDNETGSSNDLSIGTHLKGGGTNLGAINLNGDQYAYLNLMTGDVTKGIFLLNTNASPYVAVYTATGSSAPLYLGAEESANIILTGGAGNQVMRLTGSQTVPVTITAPATVGAQTINKMAGSVNFAAAAASLVVTNSLVTTNSIIIVTVATNDSTFTSARVVAAAGSFTIHANSAATAETRVNFLVINKGD